MSNLGLRHHASRRVGRRLYSLADRLIYIAAVASPIALLPQVYQIYATHEVAGLSILSWTAFTLINIVWLVYGLGHKEGPIILSNLLLFIFNTLVVFGIVLYH